VANTSDSGTAVAVPSPPDMSVAPPPGTVVTAAMPVPQASASMNTAATSVMTASTVVTGISETTEVPDGATACQPGICPAFAANGSVTNTLGTDDPSAAHAYLLAAGGATSGVYPDLGNLPTVILPAVPVTVTEDPDPDPATEQAP
jgi:hypothetical protein